MKQILMIAFAMSATPPTTAAAKQMRAQIE
jgi:hypothetical protein